VSSDERPSSLLLWATLAAAPVALAFETALRRLLFPPEFDLVRDLFRSHLTPISWGLVVAAAAGGWIGLRVQAALSARRLERLPEGVPLRVRHATTTSVFLLTTLAPQLPSIVVTLCFTLGSALLPVVVAIAVTSAGVAAQAVQVTRLAEAERPEGPASSG